MVTTTTTNPSSNDEDIGLDWIQLRKSFGSVQVETTKEKLVRKLKENPLVPIGELFITYITFFGVYIQIVFSIIF